MQKITIANSKGFKELNNSTILLNNIIKDCYNFFLFFQDVKQILQMSDTIKNTSRFNLFQIF